MKLQNSTWIDFDIADVRVAILIDSGQASRLHIQYLAVRQSEARLKNACEFGETLHSSVGRLWDYIPTMALKRLLLKELAEEDRTLLPTLCFWGRLADPKSVQEAYNGSTKRPTLRR